VKAFGIEENHLKLSITVGIEENHILWKHFFIC